MTAHGMNANDLNATAPLLCVRDLWVRFGDKSVVKGVGYTLGRGERMALVGESGSGKTLSALSLLGLVADAQVTGQALFEGRDLLTLPEPHLRALRGHEIAMIFQEPMTALNPLFTIGNQIAEVIQLKQALTPAQAHPLAVELLAATGIPEPERRARSYPHQLSGGQRQRAMIAMALACKPKLLLADEPTTALDVSLRQGILDLLRELQRQNGMAVLLITHDLNTVRHFAETVVVMEHGHIVEQGPVAEVFARPHHAYTQKLLASRPVRDVLETDGRRSGDATPAPAADPDARTPLPGPVLGGEGVRVVYPVPLRGLQGWFKKGEFVAVKGADFTLRQGQTLGVMGESGSGKSTLALAVLGLVKSRGNLSVVGGQWGRGAASDQALRRRVQVVFQDPFSSLSPRLTVEEIVGEGLRVHEPQLSASQRRERVVRALHEVGMDESRYAGLLARYPHEFSGGQRQRLAVARALIVEPDALVLDEPTSALDVTIQQQVLQLLQTLQRERGLAYFLITHDVDVVRAMAHDVLVMQHGEVLETGTVAQVLGAPRHPYTQALVSAAG